MYCCCAIEPSPTLSSFSPSFLLGHPFSSLLVTLYSHFSSLPPPVSFFLSLSLMVSLSHFIPLPSSPLSLSSLADESRDQLKPLKWLRLAHSHWFSGRRRGAEVLGERAGDERSDVESEEESKGGNEEWFNWEYERSWGRKRRWKKEREGLG